VEGLGYLVGAHGDAQSQAAARAASWRDVTDGGAQSRALGAVDGLGQSLILIDPGLSKHYAYDQLEAETGREYGKAGGVAIQLVGLGGLARTAYQARVAAAEAARLAKLAPEALAGGAKATARATRAAAAAPPLRTRPSDGPHWSRHAYARRRATLMASATAPIISRMPIKAAPGASSVSPT